MTQSVGHTENAGESPRPMAKTTILADVLRERGALPEPELLRVFIAVLGDLESAHRDGLLHRDINPARIMLNGAGWKLAEYGHAKVGTVRYMSPERCQGKPLDVRSDIYSLGVVLYQAATGRLPFDAEMKFQVMAAHVETPPPPPHHANPEISFDLEQAILRALAKDPANRFQSAAEFRQALEAISGFSGPPPAPEPATALPAATEQSEPVVTPSRPRRIRPLAIVIPVGAVIAIAAGLLVTGALGARRVPIVTGLSSEQAVKALLGNGFKAESDTIDDTLPAGIVVSQDPEPGVRGPRSRVVGLRVSSGTVVMPSIVGMALADAREQLAKLALSPAKVDSQYSDKYAAGQVTNANSKPGTRVAPHSDVRLSVSAGRATCPDCGARREAGAKFCTKCGYKF
jgi:hypothetical protein